MDTPEHPACLLYKCPNYPCQIMDAVRNKPVICNKPGFWDKYKK